MAEIKNAFIQSKMNKDLDARLLPSGEYRNAVNAQVSKSESSDVGALQTALGNSLVIEFFPEIPGLKSIGYFADQISNTAYVFLTDHTGSDYNPSANNIICAFNISTNSFSVLAEGAFLNFSTQNPIYGVNLLESLLFWTDNRNQPRKINVLRPLGYYTSEEQISVAKYNPYSAIDLWQESVLAPGDYETTIKDVTSFFLPDGGSVFTPEFVPDATSNFATNTRQGDIDVAAGYVYFINSSGEAELLLDSTLSPVSVLSYSYLSGVMTLTGDAEIPAGTTLVLRPNPYYNADFSGDVDFLKNKFARFSYRLKFDDGEYSIFAPFTQLAFIPRQDGYFMYSSEATAAKDDQADAYRTTEVSFMENKATEIELRIPLPAVKAELRDSLKIISIDILYKESDAISVQVIETIGVDVIEADTNGGTDYYVYTYGSQKPYKTLPSNELIRVYDKVPVKALGQEIISNRVVYANFQDKHTPLPSNVTLNYNVAIDEKRTFSTAENFTSIIEYPNHNVKQNRSYQVGVVLADKFGRQSTTLLSPSNSSAAVLGQLFSGSTVYSPYIDTTIDPASFPGNSIKVLFNDPIPTDRDGNYPGVYNGDINSIDYNPLGWYSYKIVVKQTEQDYYNVYLPGVMASYPNSTAERGATSHAVLINDNINKIPRDLQEVGPTQRQFRSSVTLYGRVENTYVGTGTDYHNAQYYPEARTSMIASTIADNNELFYGGLTLPASLPVGFEQFYNIESNPLICRISTPSTFGVEKSTVSVINLAVLETDPVDSRLDIFWETTTTGLISELNEAILADTGGIVTLSEFSYDAFNEGILEGEPILDFDFYLQNVIEGQIPNTPIGRISSFTMSVTNTESTPQNVDSYFNLTGDIGITYPLWNIEVTSDFIDNVFYSSDPGTRNFKFVFTAIVDGITLVFTKYIDLSNIIPIIDTCNPVINSTINTEIVNVLNGVNGAANTALQALDLNWNITSQTTVDDPGTQVSYFSTNAYIDTGFTGDVYFGELINTAIGTLPPTSYAVTMELSDAGASTGCSFVINFGVTPESVKEYTIVDSGFSYYFTIIHLIDPLGLYTGYYTYTDSWANLSTGATTIFIPSSGYGCAINWSKTNSEGLAKAAAYSCIGFSPAIDPPVTVDTTGYLFAFV